MNADSSDTYKMPSLKEVLFAVCLSSLCVGIENDLDDKENIEINPLLNLRINPGE